MRNWKRVVQDAIRIATKLEKKLQGAEIEIYRLVRSKGSSGTQRLQKRTQCFWCEQHRCRRHVVESLIWHVFESQMALETKISRSKNNFGSKSYQKFNSDDFKIFALCRQNPCQFLIFSFRSKIIKFHIFSSTLVRFCS